MEKDFLNKLFAYKDGCLFRKSVCPGPKRSDLQAGTLFKGNGSSSCKPRWQVRVSGKKRYRSVVVWIMHNGEIPSGYQVDHINGDQLDDRIENLRLATPSQNCTNRTVRSDNKAGVKGVYFCSRSNRWIVLLSVDGKRKWFGSFESKDAAVAVALDADTKINGSFCRRQTELSA